MLCYMSGERMTDLTLNLWDLKPWRDDALSRSVGGSVYRVHAPRERARGMPIDRIVSEIEKIPFCCDRFATYETPWRENSITRLENGMAMFSTEPPLSKTMIILEDPFTEGDIGL